MKLLMLSPHGRILPTPPLGTTDTGGQVTYVLNLSYALARLGHEVTIVNRSWDGKLHRSEIAHRVTLAHVPAGPQRFMAKEEIRGVLPKLVAQLHRHDYDVVVGHYADGMRAAQMLGGFYVAVPHSLGEWKAARMNTPPPKRRIADETVAMKRAGLVVATSGAQAARIYRRYNVTGTDVAVIPPGIDSDYLYNSANPAPLGPAAVLAVGRYAENKNYRRLVEAVGLVTQRTVGGSNVVLHLVMGSDAHAAEMAKAAGERHGARVVVWDRPTDPQLRELYRGAALFAMPSTYEPFGMVACEAMGAGTATLIPAGGGLVDMMPTDARYSCDPYSVTSIATTIEHALFVDGQRRTNVAKAGQQWARDMLGWHLIAGAWEQALYRQLKKLATR